MPFDKAPLRPGVQPIDEMLAAGPPVDPSRLLVTW
jgi:hypothetical protein